MVRRAGPLSLFTICDLPFTILLLLMILEVYAKTHVGRIRAGNEDNFLLLDLTTSKAWTGTDGDEPPAEMCRFEVGERGLVLIVSDGMGGALAGDVASRM